MGSSNWHVIKFSKEEEFQTRRVLFSESIFIFVFFQVCDEVTEIQCDIVPYTECKMTMEATPYKSYEMVPKTYARKVILHRINNIFFLIIKFFCFLGLY